MLLAEIIKSAVDEEQIVECIRSNEMKRYTKARSAGQETSPVEYLYIKELIELFNKTPYAESAEFWSEDLSGYLLNIQAFRNKVMHAASSIAATTENLQFASSLPNWATEVSRRLRQIVSHSTSNNQASKGAAAN